jgi:hypothetical protein
VRTKSVLSVVKKVFPITGRGIFFLFLSAGLFIEGIIRADLASLFWGCGFLALTLYSFVGNHIFTGMIRSFFSRHPQAVNIYFPREPIFPGHEASGECKADLPSFFVPGFSIRLKIHLTFHSREPVVIGCRLVPGLNKKPIRIIPRRRGVYRSSVVRIVIEDLLGFTASRVELPLDEYVRVFPELIDRNALVFKIMGEESTDALKRKRVSDELLEIKKYYPGDDIKRLNWKVYAHTGELFVRKGEETPPPDVKLLFILDPTISRIVPDGFKDEYIDSLVEVSASMMNIVIDAGHPVMLSVPGHPSLYTFYKKGQNDLLSVLAGIFWQDISDTIVLPRKRHLHGVVVSSPGSPMIPVICHNLRERNWGISLFLKNFVFRPNGRKTFDLKGVFFTDGIKSQAPNPSAWDIINFKQSLYSEMGKYKQEPWRLSDVQEI